MRISTPRLIVDPRSEAFFATREGAATLARCRRQLAGERQRETGIAVDFEAQHARAIYRGVEGLGLASSKKRKGRRHAG